MHNRNRACMHNAVLGVVNRHGRSKSTISSVHGPCLVLRGKKSCFMDVSGSLTTRHDTQSLKLCRYFVNDDNDNDRWID